MKTSQYANYYVEKYRLNITPITLKKSCLALRKLDFYPTQNSLLENAKFKFHSVDSGEILTLVATVGNNGYNSLLVLVMNRNVFLYDKIIATHLIAYFYTQQQKKIVLFIGK